LQSELIIIAQNEIIDFDYSLIGHFILFKEECANLEKIKIVLNNNISSDNRNQNSFVWKLKQQMVHAYYSVGGYDVFTLEYGQKFTSNPSN
jgi:hypothetical protein